MKILAYGEDALTLWAISRRLPSILQRLDDLSDPKDCQVLFRPSFGRRGGLAGPQFGEFDFIVLSRSALYLGESKWDRSSEEVLAGSLVLRPEQVTRHRVFRFYVEEFAYGPHANWAAFTSSAAPKFQPIAPGKSLAPVGSLLAQNIEQVLTKIRSHFTEPPRIQDVLLFLHGGPFPTAFPRADHQDSSSSCSTTQKMPMATSFPSNSDAGWPPNSSLKLTRRAGHSGMLESPAGVT